MSDLSIGNIFSILLGALISWITIWIRESLSSKSQVKLERLKLYDSEVFRAYNDLYRFVRLARLYWEPGVPREEYIRLIKGSSFKEIMENMLFYSPEIQNDLETLEIQYRALGEPDLIFIEKSFEEFISTDFLDLLNRLETAVKQLINEILQK